MCGIAGGINIGTEKRSVDKTIVSHLNDLQRQRGPDGAGLWVSDDERIVLGHRRLAIIDTGSSGSQPMEDISRRWVITFNGEIYNYRELRSELALHGHVFATHSDTEVLIKVIAQWGEAGLSKLRGMFAFALWDSENRELWLARDPYGSMCQKAAVSSGSHHARGRWQIVRRSIREETRLHSQVFMFGVMYRSLFRGGRGSQCFLPAMSKE
jgi:asparagine synthase (glutamine-hydrolysing)